MAVNLRSPTKACAVKKVHRLRGRTKITHRLNCNFWTKYLQHQANIYRGASVGGGGVDQQKNTVSDLCQSDRHFLAFSDTTRNERHRKYN